MSLEFPMFSPFQPAKLYHGFVYDEEDDIDKQLVNFATCKKIKWIFEGETKVGTFQPISGLIMKEGKFRIRTNSLEDIEEGDLIELQHPTLKKQYFKVCEQPQIEYIFCPKCRQTYPHILLTTISNKHINPREGD